MDNEFHVINLLPSTPPIPRIAGTHPLLKPVRHLSFPTKSPEPSPDNSEPSGTFIPSLPVCDWSVMDVGRFIQTNFPDKSISRVNHHLCT